MAPPILALAAGTHIVFGRQDGRWPWSLWILIPLTVLLLGGVAAWIWWPRRPKGKRKRGRWAPATLAGLCGFLLVVAGCPVGPLSFGGSSICRICGAEMYESNSVFVPFLAVEHVRPTELSDFAEGNGLVVPHQHVWSFMSGGGGGFCALGEAHGLESVSADVGAREFLEATIKWRGKAEARRWLRIMLTPAEGNDMTPCTFLMQAWPTGAVDDRARCEQWRTQALESMRRMCAHTLSPSDLSDSPP